MILIFGIINIKNDVFLLQLIKSFTLINHIMVWINFAPLWMNKSFLTRHCNYKLSNRCPHYVMGRLSLLHGVPSRYIHVHVYIYTVYELSLNNGENFFLEPLCSSYISNSFQENCQQHIELSANARCFSFVTHLSCWRLNRAFLIFRCLSL